MHPIFFRIPLPKTPLKLWWAMAAIAALSILFAVPSIRRKEMSAIYSSLAFAAGAGVIGWMYRETKFDAPNLPIYSYGVMLGLSLIVGWYISLPIAEKYGLPKETMANCYVLTAISAVIGSRLLYVATNPSEVENFADLLKFRSGGLVAYGGFIGGLLASWLYLSSQRIRLLPWADAAVPSLAAGVMITRIGCYLFGCDFGRRLTDGAPAFLKKMGTFPGKLEGVDASPAYLQHLKQYRESALGSEILKNNASLPVHPTQIYEAIVGLVLLVWLLLLRRQQKFRGEIFYSFVFGYGVLRFLVEMLRDDEERGAYGPYMAEHILVPGALLLLALGFVFGLALGIKNEKVRTVLRLVAIAVPIALFVKMKPASFAAEVSTRLSTSQWIAVFSSLAVAFFYAKGWDAARKNPRAAMARSTLGEIFAKEEEDEAKSKKKKKKKTDGTAATPEGESETKADDAEVEIAAKEPGASTEGAVPDGGPEPEKA